MIIKSKHSAWHSLESLAHYWPRLLEGTKETIRQRYTGSAFGSMWALLFPSLQLSIFAVLYTCVFKVRPSGLNEWDYVVLVFSGLVPILMFNEALTAASSSLSASKSLLLNTVFPAELIPVRALLSSQVSGLFGLVLTVLLAVAVGRANAWTLLAVPLAWLGLFLFTMGIGWTLSLASLVAKDIQHGLGLFTMLVTILSPFAYTPEMVPQALKPLIYLNPLAYYVQIFQSLICYGAWPSVTLILTASLLSVGSFLGGFLLFRNTKNLFLDYA